MISLQKLKGWQTNEKVLRKMGKTKECDIHSKKEKNRVLRTYYEKQQILTVATHSSRKV